jgi:hypothetical protein
MTTEGHSHNRDDDDFRTVTVRAAASRGLDWVFNQVVPTVILTAILAFMAYREVHLQPVRDEKQAAAYERIQESGQKFFDAALQKIITDGEKRQAADEKRFLEIREDNQKWREALMNQRGISFWPRVTESDGLVKKTDDETELQTNN